MYVLFTFTLDDEAVDTWLYPWWKYTPEETFQIKSLFFSEQRHFFETKEINL